jgi:hypothetical protein
VNPQGHDPIVGAWYGKFVSDAGTNSEYVGYGTVTFLSDGTIMTGDTTVTGGLGNMIATTPTGVWHKISQKDYEVTAITIYSSIVNLPAPTTPLYTFIEHTKLTLSNDCNDFTTYEDTYTLFSPADLAFKNPIKSGTLDQTYSRVTINSGK